MPIRELAAAVAKAKAEDDERAIAKQGDQTTEGRWLIIGIQPQGSAPTS